MQISVEIRAEGISINPRFGTLTDEHAAVNYGMPVVVIEGRAHGPGDLPGVDLHPVYYHRWPMTDDDVTETENGNDLILAAQRAGWYITPTVTIRES